MAALEPKPAEELPSSSPRLAPQLQAPTASAVEVDSSQRVDLAAGSGAIEEVDEPLPPKEWVLGENLVEGIVLDATTHEPIAHARVRMEGLTIQSTETAEDGTFRLEATDFVRTLAIAAGGYARQWHYPLRLALVPVDERGYVFYLEPGAELKGIALKDDGSPVTTGVVRAYEHQLLPKIANLTIRGDGPQMLTGWLDQASEAISKSRPINWVYSLAPSAPLDDKGRFHFDSLPTGTSMHLAVWSDEVLLDLHEEAALEPKEVRQIELVSREAYTLTGTIELPFGVLPELTELWFNLRQRSPRVRFSPYDRMVPIGPHGEFDSGPLPPGKHIWIQARFMVAPDSPERIILEWEHDLDSPTRKLYLRMNGLVEDPPSGL